jgi:hypothetical protein
MVTCRGSQETRPRSSASGQLQHTLMEAWQLSSASGVEKTCLDFVCIGGATEDAALVQAPPLATLSQLAVKIEGPNF